MPYGIERQNVNVHVFLVASAKCESSEQPDERSEDQLDEPSKDRRRFMRKLLTLGATAGVVGFVANGVPSERPVEQVYAATGGDMLIDKKNVGSSGTVLESDWASASNLGTGVGVGTLNTINHGTGSSGVAYPTAFYGEVSDQYGTAVAGVNTATSGYTAGVFGASEAGDGNGVYGQAVFDTPGLWGVLGDTPSTQGAVGVGGIAYATSGFNAGVYGETDSPGGAGVQGNAYANGGWAVFGFSRSPGVVPIVGMGNTSGGQTANLQEWWLNNLASSALSVVNASGSLGVWNSSPQFNVHVIGTTDPASVTVDGIGIVGPNFQ